MENVKNASPNKREESKFIHLARGMKSIAERQNMNLKRLGEKVETISGHVDVDLKEVEEVEVVRAQQTVFEIIEDFMTQINDDAEKMEQHLNRLDTLF